jgi:hypothetical protein
MLILGQVCTKSSPMLLPQMVLRLFVWKQQWDSTVVDRHLPAKTNDLWVNGWSPPNCFELLKWMESSQYWTLVRKESEIAILAWRESLSNSQVSHEGISRRYWQSPMPASGVWSRTDLLSPPLALMLIYKYKHVWIQDSFNRNWISATQRRYSIVVHCRLQTSRTYMPIPQHVTYNIAADQISISLLPSSHVYSPIHTCPIITKYSNKH